MHLSRPILRRSANDDLIYLNINYQFGQNWVDCGISMVSQYLKALGFTSLNELECFCKHINVFNTFSDKRLMKTLVSEEDRAILWEFRSFLDKNKLTPFPIHYNINNTKDFEVSNPKFPDFFQFIFTWVTGGDGLSPTRRRESFIKWWETQKNNFLSIKKYYYSPHTVRWIWQTETFPVTKPFKTLVDTFLTDYRAGKYNQGTGLQGVNDPADLVHQWQKEFAKILLRESKWKYVSGNSLNVGAAIPSTDIGVSAGGGHYYFYSDEAKKKHYPVYFGQLSVSVGVNAIPSPVSGALDLAAFPSYGTLFEIRQHITTPQQLNGMYLFVSGSAGIIGNLNNNLIFFLSILEIGSPALYNVDKYLKEILGSKAGMIVTGHGLESVIGGGVGMGYGVVNVLPPIETR